MPDANRIPTLARHFRLQWEPSQESYVLLYPEGMVRLNASAGEILTACNGAASTAAIARSLQKRYPQADTLYDDVCAFLSEALDHGWIELRY